MLLDVKVFAEVEISALGTWRVKANLKGRFSYERWGSGKVLI
jgi:hypothetical protein